MTAFDVALLVGVSWALWLAFWLALPLWVRNRKPSSYEVWGAGVVSGLGVLLFLLVIAWQAAP